MGPELNPGKNILLPIFFPHSAIAVPSQAPHVWGIPLDLEGTKQKPDIWQYLDSFGSRPGEAASLASRAERRGSARPPTPFRDALGPISQQRTTWYKIVPRMPERINSNQQIRHVH